MSNGFGLVLKLEETGKLEKAEKHEKKRPWCSVDKSFCQCSYYLGREMLVDATQPFRCASQG